MTKPATEYKPYFALSTNRTYSTSDRTRVWINYLGIDFLDFRLYRVKDPSKFFAKLKDPHKMGEPEKQAMQPQLKIPPLAGRKAPWSFQGLGLRSRSSNRTSANNSNVKHANR